MYMSAYVGSSVELLAGDNMMGWVCEFGTGFMIKYFFENVHEAETLTPYGNVSYKIGDYAIQKALPLFHAMANSHSIAPH